MLKRLAWGLKQIIPIIDKLLDITLYDDLKEEWNNFKEIADTNNKLNEGKGKLFNGKVNCKIILTQSTLNGLGVENNNSITCNANSIPNKYALEYSKSFIPKLIEWNKKTLKLVIILGKDASICWGNSINIKKIFSLKIGGETKIYQLIKMKSFLFTFHIRLVLIQLIKRILKKLLMF